VSSGRRCGTRARLKALVEAGVPHGSEREAGIGKVEKKYKQLAAERRPDTFFQELKAAADLCKVQLIPEN
jgi:hypothetical protein